MLYIAILQCNKAEALTLSVFSMHAVGNDIVVVVCTVSRRIWFPILLAVSCAPRGASPTFQKKKKIIRAFKIKKTQVRVWSKNFLVSYLRVGSEKSSFFVTWKNNKKKRIERSTSKKRITGEEKKFIKFFRRAGLTDASCVTDQDNPPFDFPAGHLFFVGVQCVVFSFFF